MNDENGWHDMSPARAAAKTPQGQSLPPAQLLALDALLAGKSVTEAAAAASVDRTTVHGWLRKDFAFRAALSRGRRDLRQAITHRLERLAAAATDRVAKAVEEGDLKTSLAIVKSLDVFADRYLESDDPAELRLEDDERSSYMEDRAEHLLHQRTLRR